MSQPFNAASLARENVKTMTPYMSARRLGEMATFGSMPMNTQLHLITNSVNATLTVILNANRLR